MTLQRKTMWHIKLWLFSYFLTLYYYNTVVFSSLEQSQQVPAVWCISTAFWASTPGCCRSALLTVLTWNFFFFCFLGQGALFGNRWSVSKQNWHTGYMYHMWHTLTCGVYCMTLWNSHLSNLPAKGLLNGLSKIDIPYLWVFSFFSPINTSVYPTRLKASVEITNIG